MKVLVDDARVDGQQWDFHEQKFVEYAPMCDLVIRKPKLFLQVLRIALMQDLVGELELWLDHDMGEEELIDFVGFKEEDHLVVRSNGYGILEAIEFVYQLNGSLPKSITLVTSNASARVKMEAMLKKYYPVFDGKTYRRK